VPGGGSAVLVALGDSYMSGEGAAVYYQGTDDGGGNQCRRSPTAWAALAAQQPPFDRLAFLACSGAAIRNVPEVGPIADATAQSGEQDTQLGSYHALQQSSPFTPRMVVLSLGGNDSGFSTLGLMCLAPGDCSTQQKLWFDTLDQVEPALRQAYDEIDAAFPATPVVVTAYPDPIDNTPDPATGRIERCGQVALMPAERVFVSRFVTALNERIRRVATEKGFHFLEQMQNSLAASHLQLCDPLNDDRPGLDFIGLRSVSGTAEQRFNPKNWAHGSLHPNERGHAALLRTFQAWLTASGDLPARTSSPPARDAYSGFVAVEAPCSLFDPSPSGCRLQGSAWAERQVGEMLFPLGGLAGVLAVAGAWALSVAVLGRRRPPEAVPAAAPPPVTPA
jgi:lysophospholipase L1-like esterase